MLITSTLNPPKRSQISQPSTSSEASSTTFHNEPIDGWNPGESQAMADLAPYSMAVIGAAAGLVAGFAEGPAATIGGAVAVGAAGTAGALFLSGMNELGGGESHYGRNALIGGAIGAGIGAFAGSAGGPLVGIAAAALGAGGGYLTGAFTS